MAENLTEKTAADQAAPGDGRQAWHSLGLVALGIVLGAALVLLFLAYSQPELLLEQMNLRYCG